MKIHDVSFQAAQCKELHSPMKFGIADRISTSESYTWFTPKSIDRIVIPLFL